MRIIYTFTDQKKAELMSQFLTSEGIENQLDIAVEKNWGSDEYGDLNSKLWIYDEDKVDDALRWLNLYEKEPTNPVFKAAASQNIQFLKPTASKTNPSENPQNPETSSRQKNTPPVSLFQATGKITFYLIVLCGALLFFSDATSPAFVPYPAAIPPTALFSSPIKRSLLYDYPHAYELINKVTNLYGIEKLQTPNELPSEAHVLLKQFTQTPYWEGIYGPIIERVRNDIPLEKSLEVPMFEKIRDGQFWRLFTPALLHSDILHLLFNMLWLVVLGRQLEQRLGVARYLLFILITAVFSNTAQYLMSGSNFVGFSGVICAMLTFIWVRQRQAPWEGYQLEKMTMVFMTFFILAMFGIQLISFGLEITGQEAVSPGIANTAHLAGAVIGFVLGYVPLFKWKTPSSLKP